MDNVLNELLETFLLSPGNDAERKHVIKELSGEQLLEIVQKDRYLWNHLIAYLSDISQIKVDKDSVTFSMGGSKTEYTFESVEQALTVLAWKWASKGAR